MSGVAWQGLSYLLGKLLVLLSTVVLARLLTPSDFGVVGLALVFIAYVEGITDLGVAEAIVYMPADDQRNDAALLLSLLWSAVLMAVAMVAAPFVAGFFHRPDITTMFRVLSLSLLIRGTAEVPEALLRKNLRFRQRLKADLGRVLAQGAVSITLAFAGLGPWAIVYGYLSASVVWTVVAWALVPYRPGRRFWVPAERLARPLLAFGVPAAGNVLLLSLVFDIDYLIVGRQLGAQALGWYTLAFRVPELVIINVFYVLSAVAFPIFSKAQAEVERLHRGYVKAVEIQSAYGVAAGVGLAMIAPMAVRVVFGSRWTQSIVPLEALALYAAFRALGVGSIDVYKATGRPRLAFWLSVVRLAAVLPALLIAVRFGIDGVAWAQAVVALLLALLMQGVASRVLGLPPGRLAAAMIPALALGVGVAIGAGAVRLWLPGPEAMRLVAAVLAGGLGGLAMLRVVAKGFLLDVRALLRGWRPRRSAALAE
ncbi:MAG TPA: lipopolysaccharide biosynthesis protein [Actinomycetota bacterium]